MLIQDIINSLDDCQEVRINHAHQEANRVAYAVLVLGIVMNNFSHGKQISSISRKNFRRRCWGTIIYSIYF